MSATARKVPCGFCGDLITTYDEANPKATPRRYCDRHCRNEAKKQRRQKKMEPQSK
jgi:hypothetical protein